MLLTNPFTGKQVDVSDEDSISLLVGAGFKEQEPEAVESKKDSAPTARRSRKAK